MSLMRRVSRSLSLMMICRNSWALGRFEIRVVVQNFGEGTDRGERGAQFVAGGGDKVVLHSVELLQAFVRTLQLARRLLELARLLLEVAAVPGSAATTFRGYASHRRSQAVPLSPWRPRARAPTRRRSRPRAAARQSQPSPGRRSAPAGSMPRLRASLVNSRLARRGPKKRPTSARSSPSGAEPRHVIGSPRSCAPSASTNDTACARTSGDCGIRMEQPISRPRLTSIDQNRLCVIGSRPASPNSA